MKQLEVKTYTRQEIAEIIDIDVKNKNFARKTKDTLAKWGYSFEYSRKAIEITKKPETATERLIEMMIRNYDMDIQCEAYDFAVFTYCLLVDLDGFASMPWETRSNYLNEEWNILVSDRTLRNWCNKLIKTNTISKDTLNKTYWTSFSVNGVKYQEELENGRENPQWKKYWERFFELKEKGCENIGGTLYSELGYCVYSCASFVFSAFDDIMLLEDLISLINEIVEKDAFDTVVSCKIETTEIPREKEYKNEIEREFNITTNNQPREKVKTNIAASVREEEFVL